MYGYDEQIFNTLDEFLAYLSAKYGDMYDANLESFSLWGKDLQGSHLYINGIQQLGTEGQALADAGFSEAEQVMQTYTQNPAQFSANTFEQLAKVKQTKEAIIAGTNYTNGAIQLGTSEAQGGQVLTATKPIVSDNGTVFNNANVTQVEQIEDPTVPGTFSYLATLKALGWLPLPTWTAAAAPLLGVGLGVGLYDLNPELWEKISRTLLPFCYDDNTGIPKIPISVDENGNVHTPENAIEALRNLFIEEGVFATGNYEARTDTSNLYHPELIHMPVYFVQGPLSVRLSGNTYTSIYGDDNFYFFITLVKSGTYNISAYTKNLTLERIYERREYDNGRVLTYDSILSNIKTTKVGNDFKATGTGLIQLSENGYNNAIISPSLNLSSTEYQYPSSINENDIAQLVLYGDISGGAGVEGATPETGATYPTDTTKNLAEIYPTWYNNGIDVMNNPVATLLEDGVERWVPLSLSDTNFSSDTNNTSSTQTQTDAQTGTNTSNAQLNQIAQALQDLTKTLTGNGTLPKNPTIPSDPTGNTPAPTPPVITGAGSDLIAIYNPTKAQIQAFNRFLWDLDPTNLVNWKKVIANPIDAVISLHMIYVTPVTGETRNIKCGYIETDVPSVIVTNQYKEIDCGTVTIGEYFHNIWDYVATHIEIYLPFVGIVPLHVSDVMNSTIRVRYRVDVYTGACLAQIIVYKGNYSGVLYTYAGNCAVPLPLTSGSFTGVFSTLLSMGASAITAGVTGGAMTPAIAAGVTGMRHAPSIQQNIQRSGSIGSNVGALGIRTPYVIITRKVPLDAHLYETQYGFPANKTVALGNMNGYTRVKDIHLSGIPCTDDELEMIERLLKDGVIIN